MSENGHRDKNFRISKKKIKNLEKNFRFEKKKSQSRKNIRIESATLAGRLEHFSHKQGANKENRTL